MSIIETSYSRQAELFHSVKADPQGFLAEDLIPTNVSPAPNADFSKILCRVYALMEMEKWQDAQVQALELLALLIDLPQYIFLACTYTLLAKISLRIGFEHNEKPYLDQALETAKLSKDFDLISITLCNMALHHSRNKNRKFAIECVNLAKQQIKQIDSQRVRYYVFRDVGTIYYNFKLYHKAIEALSSAMQCAIHLEDIGEQLQCLNKLSSLYMMLAQYDDAKKYFEKGIDLSTFYNATFSKLGFMFNLGAMYMKLDKTDKALSTFLECMELANASGFSDTHFLIDLHNNLAGCYNHLKHSETAIEHLQAAMQHAEGINSLQTIHELKVNLANVLRSLSRFDEARELLKAAIKYSRQNKRFDTLQVALSNMALTYETQANYKKAVQYLKECNRAYKAQLNYLMSEQSKQHNEELSAVVEELFAERERTSRSEPCLHRHNDCFIGAGTVYKEILGKALKAAQHPYASVLITGETGTGKDVLANFIHQNSIRRDAIFLPVNMAAISDTLMESEFFGHKKGAFTGADRDTKGFFLEASKGSIFLDEISELPLSMQSKLLRALETRKITPVGSSKEISFDTRIICSSNKDIAALISGASFRSDLFYRLNTITIHLPPLRERTDDIVPLCTHFIDEFSKKMYKSKPKIEHGFYNALKSYSFPGNIRELRNIIEHLMIMQGNIIWTAKTLIPLISGAQVTSETNIPQLNISAEDAEKEAIIQALQKCAGKQKDAAKILGISEPTLTRKVKKYMLAIYTKKSNKY